MQRPEQWCAARLGHEFRDRELVRQALTHRSASSLHNERLEFLGDAVLSFVIADLVSRTFPSADEGELSRRRASLVSGAVLAEVAASLGVGEQLRLGEGELKSGGFRRPSILADALEALIGAVYLDAGIEAARAVVERLLEPRLRHLPAAEDLKDPKTRLQEILQSRGLALPTYTVLDVSGDPHQQTFRVRCEVPALAIAAESSAQSRRRAEQDAARQVLEQVVAELR